MALSTPSCQLASTATGYQKNTIQPTYDELIAKAAEVIQLDHVESDSTAHMDASMRMLADADGLLAVWDGQPARGFGGTADVVNAACDRGVPITVVWPADATRD